MIIKFLGTGPSTPVKGEGKNERSNTCGFVAHRDTGILIGLPKTFRESIEESNIEPEDISAVFLSHAHSDMTDGCAQFRRWLNDNDFDYEDNPIPLYAEEQTWNHLSNTFSDLRHLKHKKINPYDKFEIGSMEIVPFRVDHARNPEKFPTVGFRFGDRLTWCEDMTKVPKKSVKYFDDVDSVVIDAAMYDLQGEDNSIFNHFSTTESLEFMADKDVRRVYLIQAGRTYPKYGEAQKSIKAKWKELGGEGNAMLTYDGMEIQNLSQSLQKHNIAMFLRSGLIEDIWEEIKDLLILEADYKDYVGKNMYLVSGNRAYGIIKLKKSKRIDLEEFEELKDRHKIDDELRQKKWPNKKFLYAYEFDFHRFDRKPIVEADRTAETFIEDIELKDESIENIEDIDNYNPKKLDDAVLRDDWRYLVAYTSKKIEKGDW